MFFPKQQNELENLLDIFELAKEARLDNEGWFVQEVEKLSFRWDNFRYQKLLQKCIQAKSFPSLINQTFRKPVENDLECLKGDYNIGHVINTNILVGLKKKALNLHTLISGATGFGKTNSLIALSDCIRKEGEIVEWIIDPKGLGDYRYQIKDSSNTLILPLSALFLNPFQEIENVPRNVLMLKSIELLSDAFSVYDASEGVLAEHVHKVFEMEEFPCFKDVFNSIMKEKIKGFGRKQGYYDTLFTRLIYMSLALCDVFNCRRDYFNHILLNDYNVVFEVEHLSDFIHKLITQFLIMKISLFKLYNPSPKISHLLAFEEAQGIFSKLLEQRGRVPAVGSLVTKCRATGLGVVILCTNPATKIITEMISNSASLLSFHLGGTEVKGMMDCMGLTTDQADMFQHLPPGEAIVKLNVGYTHPLHVRINHINTTAPSDDEFERIMKPKWDELLSLVKPVENKTEIELSKNIEATKNSIVQSSTMSSSKTTEPENGTVLNPDDEILLKDIQFRPYQYTEDRYRQSTLSRNRVFKAKVRLCRLGYLEEEKIKTGSRGKPPTILRLKEKAVSYLGIPASKGKGGIEHSFWQHFIIHLAKNIKGLKAKIEDMSADVSVSNGKTEVAIEITLFSSNILKHVERNIRNGYAEVWFAVKDKAMLKRVNEKLVARILKQGKVKVFLLEEIAIEIKKHFSEEHK